MSKDIKQILDEALTLDNNGRATLETSLIDSLEDLTDSDVDDAWEIELQKRLYDIKNNNIKYFLVRC